MIQDFNIDIYSRNLWIATSWEDVKDKFTTYGGYEFKKSEDAYATTYPQMMRKKSKNYLKQKGGQADMAQQESSVNHPTHYNQHPSGIECIDIVRHYDFNIGNVIKYIWRAGLKHEKGMNNRDKQIEDMEKAMFYLKDEIEMLKRKRNEEKE